LVNPAPVAKDLRGATGLQTHILSAEKAGGEDAGEAIHGDGIELSIDLQGHNRLVGFPIECYALYTADADPRHGYRGAYLEAADVLEPGGDPVPLSAGVSTQVADHNRKEKQRQKARRHEQPHQDLDRASMRHGSSSEHQGGQDKIQSQHGQGRMHDRPGRGTAHPRRRGQRVVTLKQGDPTD